MGQQATKSNVRQRLNTDDSIRLLRLTLTDNSHTATFEETTLPAAPSYIALSYVWGPREPKNTFAVSGQSLTVTPNLSSFLEHFLANYFLNFGTTTTNGETEIRLWIDALCINQEDISERNHQVKLMPEIYKGARMVIMWLGPDDFSEDSVLALNQVMIAAEFLVALSKRNESPIEVAALLEKPWELIDCVEDLGRDVIEVAPWEALGRFVERAEWWQRIWTVQESCNAKEAKFMVGASLVDSGYFDMAGIIFIFLFRSGRISFTNEGKKGIEVMNGRLEVRLSSGKSSLYCMLKLLRKNKATDPRDKVFAALSLASDEASKVVCIEYQSGISEVYIQVSDYLMKTHLGLEWLESSIGSGVSDLPSWVPDWSMEKTYRYPLSGTMHSEPSPAYLASGSQPLMPRVIFAPNREAFELNLKGVYIGRITSISGTNDLRQMATESWMVDLLSRMAEPYPGTGEKLLQALYRTLLLDCVWKHPGKLVVRGIRNFPKDLRQGWEGLDESDLLVKLYSSPVEWVEGWPFQFNTLSGRRLAITEKGYIGLVDDTAIVGDHVVLLLGSQVLHILRPDGSSVYGRDNPPRSLFTSPNLQAVNDEANQPISHVLPTDEGIETIRHDAIIECEMCTEVYYQRYKLVGEAYIHGLMDGEALRLPGSGGIRHIILT